MTEEVSKFIDSMPLPQDVKEELKRKHTLEEMPKTKKVAVLEGNDKEAIIILWDDDTVTITSSGGGGIKEPYFSSAKTPDQFYIALAYYKSLGLKVISEELPKFKEVEI